VDIIPAIDLRQGKCVRFKQGREEHATEYSADPNSVAQEWVRQGARRLHIVNLDGAFGRASDNFSIVRDIVRSTAVTIQFGGGLRTREAIESALEAGVAKVVLGTLAFENRSVMEECLRRYGPDRIIVALDTVDGKIALRGWLSVSEARVEAAAADVYSAGVKEILYTDILRDGMMSGPDIEKLNALTDIGLRVIASGGVASEMDVRTLMNLRKENLIGVIIGKALYEQTVSLPSLIALAGGR
jgi:phosphoribosylformimino-5-aminoimidazole carboxamide ribotide isomerase